MSEYPKTVLQAKLARLVACSDARDWVGDRSLTRAWQECQRAEWMLWLAAKAGVDRRTLVLAACACARTALRHVRKGETRPLVAIETAERWARGEATLDDVREAARAATAASTAAYAAYAATAAYYAAAAAAAAPTAAYVAYAAYAAYYAAAAAAEHTMAHRRMATLVRRRISLRAVQAAMRGVK